MNTQQKINGVLLLAVVALIALMVWNHAADNRRDAVVASVGLKAAKAAAVDSATRARLKPYMDSVGRELATMKSEQSTIKSTIALNVRKNENLNKQIDSLNARLGVRPRF